MRANFYMVSVLLRRSSGKNAGSSGCLDVFGYSWALPQIMKLCGLDTFMTTKISWNQFNTVPNDLLPLAPH